jgi:lipopolysaccharide export system protein LptC
MATAGIAARRPLRSRTADARQAAFRAAVRHSRRVRLLRVGLPAFAVLLAAAFVASIIYDPRSRIGPQVDVESLGLTGATITMQKPKLTGYSTEGRPYQVNAERAEQSLAEPQKVSLFKIDGRMQNRDDGWLTLLSDTGNIDNDKKLMDLSGAIRLGNDLGDRALLSTAHIDFGGGDLSTGDPVDLSFGETTLTADRMQIFDHGNQALFQGRVVMTITPKPDAAAAENGAPQ